MKVRIALALDPELLKRVDEARGDVPRQRFIQRALERALSPNGQDSPEPQRAVEAALEKIKRENERLKAKDEWLEPAKPKIGPKPKTCPKHPDAGKIKSRGKTYCDYGGCQFVYR